MKMPNYVALWEINMSGMLINPHERSAAHLKMLDMVKQVLKDNPGSDFGVFIGEHKGYVTGIKNWQTIVKIDQMFSPLVTFKVYQALSIAEDEEVWKSMMK
jgi:hypothetical protein